MFAPDGQDRQMVNLGADILDYFSKLWGRHTPSHSHNVQPCLWYTFLLHVHGHEYSSTRFCVSEVNQLFEQNCIEKQIFNGTFTLRLHYMMKTLISSFFTFLLIYIQELEISRLPQVFFKNIKMRPKYNKKCYNH